MKKHTLSVLVENQPGLLSKVVSLFARRGFNIDSLAVGITEDPDVSRITIVVQGDDHLVEQVEKQLNKLIQVIKVKVLEEGQFHSRELTLIKVSCKTQDRIDLMKIAELMQSRIIDVATTSLTFEMTDTSERTQTLLDLLHPYGIKEIVRTGAVAIEKGSRVTKKTK